MHATPSAVMQARPFTCHIPDAAIRDLRDRLARTRWPEPEPVSDWSQGVPLAYLREICEYWADGYDWRRFESQLNSFDQYLVSIGGVDIHFLHAPSRVEGARPLILTHGWPGSVVEFLDVIEPLRDPQSFGGDPQDAFHVVVPSLPGYGFSGKPAQTGWNLQRIADAWVELMRSLGYHRFFAQGGDWGSMVATHLGIRHPDAVAGVHLNLGLCNPEELLQLGTPTEAEQRQLAKFQQRADWGRLGERLFRAAAHPAADGRIRPDRLTGRAVCLDPGEVLRLDRLRRSSGAGDRTGQVARQHLPVLVHRDRGLLGAAVLESFRAAFADFTPLPVPDGLLGVPARHPRHERPLGPHPVSAAALLPAARRRRALPRPGVPRGLCGRGPLRPAHPALTAAAQRSAMVGR